MIETKLIVDTGIDLRDSQDTLTFISEYLCAQQYVKPTYRQAIFEREANFPTGIDLGFGAVAIPHCDASHANKPCIYLIKPKQPVKFDRADDEGKVEVHLIIALVVTDPKEQMTLLRSLFSSLQDEDFYRSLTSSGNKQELETIFTKKILLDDKEIA